MMKSGYLLVAAAMIGAVTVAGDTQAQMRTRKGEYYEGIQRKPYGHYFWIWPPEDRQPAYEPRRGRDADDSRPQKGRRPPTR
ncbi:hypothetical protein [Ensifer sp. LC163]|uniref:hypothetical protein n=1 Tax=Ensifer sp. LC163 TaxID=1120652 RepID=UPI000813BD63|nr:hypothetical protein [Ensifer sp. LC163]OCP35134.1 hypothetical protein BC360_28260 [Ensifer sp. LC163]